MTEQTPETPTIVLTEEDVHVETRPVERARVRVEVVTREKPVTVSADLFSDHVEVERRPRGFLIDTVPDIREEDGLLIIPVVDEEIVVERRLRLREELVVRRTRRHETFQETVTSRFQEVLVTRTRAGCSSEDGGEGPATTPTEVTRDE